MNNKFLFAHYLRGFAALCVLFAHFTTSFFISNDFISSAISVPKAKDLSFPNIILDFIPVEFPGFMSVFGVAVFFLISGFLIPISIEKYSALTFLKKRFFRLYPTYLSVCLINIAVIVVGFLIYAYPKIGYAYSFMTVLSMFSMGFSQYMKNTIAMDPVAWTLAIEVLFYISTLLFFRFSFLVKKEKQIGISDVVLLSVLLSIIVVVLSRNINLISNEFSSFNFGFLIKAIYMTVFMLIGTTFSLFARNRISARKLVGCVVLQYFIFVYITMKLDISAFYISTVTTFSWFGVAILVFSLLFSVNHKLSFNKRLNFLGDVSYPLYLCHSYIGYFIIGIVISWGVIPKSLAVFTPLPVVLYLAYIVHIKVENKFVTR